MATIMAIIMATIMAIIYGNNHGHMGQLKDRGVLGAANLQTKFKNIFEII